MKYLNKLASVFFIAMLGMLTMTSCEGGDLYDIGSPEWLSEMGGGEEDDGAERGGAAGGGQSGEDVAALLLVHGVDVVGGEAERGASEVDAAEHTDRDEFAGAFKNMVLQILKESYSNSHITPVKIHIRQDITSV